VPLHCDHASQSAARASLHVYEARPTSNVHGASPLVCSSPSDAKADDSIRPQAAITEPEHRFGRSVPIKREREREIDFFYARATCVLPQTVSVTTRNYIGAVLVLESVAQAPSSAV